MNNNSKRAWRQLSKDDRRALAEAGKVRKSKHPKVARSGGKRPYEQP